MQSDLWIIKLIGLVQSSMIIEKEVVNVHLEEVQWYFDAIWASIEESELVSHQEGPWSRLELRRYGHEHKQGIYEEIHAGRVQKF